MPHGKGVETAPDGDDGFTVVDADFRHGNLDESVDAVQAAIEKLSGWQMHLASHEAAEEKEKARLAFLEAERKKVEADLRNS